MVNVEDDFGKIKSGRRLVIGKGFIVNCKKPKIKPTMKRENSFDKLLI